MEKNLHRLVKMVTEDLEQMKFNTIVSKMMIFINDSMKIGSFHPATARTFSLLLSPLAPHIAEELWSIYGGKKSLSHEPWPTFDPELAKQDMLTIGVQVNGKTRASVDVPADLGQEDFLQVAKGNPKLEKYFDQAFAEITKVIYIPNKICNIIVKEKA